jgi:isoleucyl-tRNA synthetase
VREAYDRFELHTVHRSLVDYVSTDLSSFYLDVLKDRLYTCGVGSAARRSAQTALWHVTNALVRLMAPILSFTAEELWQVFTGKGDDSVFFQTMHELPKPAGADELLKKWDRLRELRAPVLKSIEDLRVAGKVGSSLQAEVDLHMDGADRELLQNLGDELKFVMLTSAARVHHGAGELRVEVAPSAHAKCERCWHYRADVNEAGLCGRCRSNLDGPGEPRTHA